MGGAGAWAYQTYVAPRLAKQGTEPDQANAGRPDRTATDLTARVDDLSGKVDQLRSRVDAPPKPSPPPDLEPIKTKLASIDDVSKRVETLGEKIDALPKRIDQQGHEIAALGAELDEVRKGMAGLRAEVSPGRRGGNQAGQAATPGTEAAGASSRDNEGLAADSELKPGIDLFQQRRYKEAADSFSNLARSKPDDARVWYYAAVARGFATGDWKGETERLVTRGVEREKAGTPEKSMVDSAFSGLRPEGGKDWLNFYRRRANQQGGAGR
jgi:outer membrane murein-binding lipoprotein Lpp